MTHNLILAGAVSASFLLPISVSSAHDFGDRNHDRGDQGNHGDRSDRGFGAKDANRDPTACSDVAEMLGWMANDPVAWSKWSRYVEYPKCLGHGPPTSKRHR